LHFPAVVSVSFQLLRITELYLKLQQFSTHCTGQQGSVDTNRSSAAFIHYKSHFCDSILNGYERESLNTHQRIKFLRTHNTSPQLHN